MNLPFSADQFIGLFSQYNSAIWPMQVVMYVLTGIAVILVCKRLSYADRFISSILGVIWVWNGLVYHIMFFTSINKAAYLFGALFILQGIMIWWYGGIKGEIDYSSGGNASRLIGGLLLLYAAVAYPLIGAFLGHGYPHLPLLGVAPCPTTIFTFAFILFAQDKIPLRLFWIPFLWSLIGFSASYTLGITEDIGLVVAGLLTAVLLVCSKYYMRNASRNL